MLAGLRGLALVAVALAVLAAAARPADHVAPTPAATAGVRLPFAKHVRHDLIKHAATRDRERARALIQRANSKNATAKTDMVKRVQIENLATTYVAAVKIGSPSTTFILIVDTGSSNTWVGAGQPFPTTGTTRRLGLQASVQYGSGFYVGQQVLDQVDFGSSIVVYQQSLSVASASDGFSGVDGILGLGPTGLTIGTVQSTNTVPTITDNLFSQGVISSSFVSVSFVPSNLTSSVNGELTFGAIDTSRFTGTLYSFPTTTTFPSSEFFGIDASITVLDCTTILTSSGIIDTGTTLVLLATDAFQEYVEIAGAVFDNNVGLWRVTPAQFAVLPALEIEIDGIVFPLTADAQRWPHQLNTAIGGSASAVYLVVSDLGEASGSGLDFVLGQAFLERFYSVFHSSGVVSLAGTKFTGAVVNN